MMERCAIFIDGGYLDALLKKWEDFPLDYIKFTEKICATLGVSLLRVYYYNCLPIIRSMYWAICSKCGSEFEVHFIPDDEKAYFCDKCFIGKPRKKIFISDDQTERDRTLHDNKQRFYNKLKKLPRFEIKYGNLQLIGDKFKQKGIDVLMSLDVVDRCFSKQIQHVILIAGDSDFIPAIKRAKDCGSIVHLFCNKNQINRELLYEVDEVHDLNLTFVESCKKE